VTKLVRNCKIAGRGDDWVVLLVDVSYGRRIPDLYAVGAELASLAPRLAELHPERAALGTPRVLPSGLRDDCLIFRFKVKPFSDEVNDLFRYVYDFGEMASGAEKAEAMLKQAEKAEPAEKPDWVGYSLKIGPEKAKPLSLRVGPAKVRSLAARAGAV